MKNNRRFIVTMIATGVVGLIVLMIMMFAGVKYYLGGNNEPIVQDNNIKQEESVANVEYSSTVLLVVNEITDEEIKGLDVDNSKNVSRSINHSTKVSDAYGKTIPLSSIKKGDIVEVVYEEEKARTVSISKSKRAWVKSEVNGVKVNEELKQLKLFGISYSYDDRIMVYKKDGIEIKIGNVNACDVVTLQGVDDKVYSIRIEEGAGKINIIDIPDKNGRVELDINTMISLSEISGPIDVVPGKHKVNVMIKGYEIVSEEIDVQPGETVQLSLDSTKRAYTNVSIILNNADIANYTVTVGSKTYNKGDRIYVPQGSYTLTINALGYIPWTRNINLTKDSYVLRATLQKEETEEDTEKSETSTTTSNSSNTTTEENNMQATGETKTINIATDPTGANVYINGVNKGTTPYEATLQMGSYSILLEKNGYEVYSTSIILDGSDDQTSFLYVLTPNS